MASIETEIVNRFVGLALGLGWSARTAAKQIDVSRQYYEAVMNERKQPSLEVLTRMLQSLRTYRKMLENRL